MPFTQQQISDAGKVGLDFFLKNKPIDQVAQDRPFLQALLQGKKEFPGAKQYVVEQLRSGYQSNFQFYRGSGQVTYNERKTIEQTQFPWVSAHDGYQIDEDRLAQNGITVTDSKVASASQAEVIQLTNLFEEHNEVLMEGFKEKFSAHLHLDGSLSSDAIIGLDTLVTLAADPTGTTQQVVGGLDRYTYPWWRNYKKIGLSNSTILDEMELGFRTQSIHGGAPNKIFGGGAALDAFRANAKATGNIERFLNIPQKGGVVLDPSVTGLAFHGIELQFCPEWETNFDGMTAPATSWAKRLYMLNMKYIKLRPLAGQDMVTRKPPRPHDRYVMYMGLTWKGALTMNMASAQGVYALT